MKKSELIEFCKDNKIFVPVNSKNEVYIRAIVRAYGHNNESLSFIFNNSCYGAWDNEDSNCRVCDFAKSCFTSSVGLPQEEYEKELLKLENPKFRFTTKSIKQPRAKPRAKKDFK